MTATSISGKLLIILEMIKIEHTVFALPFAFLGAFLGARGCPDWKTSGLILLAMVGARSAAMAFNRLVDRRIDAKNPRTSNRALPRGLVTPLPVLAFILASCVLFLCSAWLLNPLAFHLSPLALAIVLLYSFTKRFTSFSHLFLGLSLGIAPVGGWIAVTGSWENQVLIVAGAVMFWVAGFDIIYSCQDAAFDGRQGLFSIPSRLGIRRALHLAILLHLVMVALLAWAFLAFELSLTSWAGLLIVCLALVYEHSLVRADDLSRVDAAFFRVNGIISLLLFGCVGIDLCLFA